MKRPFPYSLSTSSMRLFFGRPYSRMTFSITTDPFLISRYPCTILYPVISWKSASHPPCKSTEMFRPNKRCSEKFRFRIRISSLFRALSYAFWIDMWDISFIPESLSTELSPAGTFVWPQPLLPQAPAVPLSWSTTVWIPPAARAVPPLKPTGTLVWPELLSPQATTVPTL
jgi:hypothetical protein